MSEGEGKPKMPAAAGITSPATQRTLVQLLDGGHYAIAWEATGLLRKVQVAYGRGSWPNIDDFLDRLDKPQADGADL